MAGAERPAGNRGGYRRDGFTVAAFGLLAGFGVLNAVLGPALPYLRAVEHASYLVGVLHQVAFAVGGGLAGVLSARVQRAAARAAVIRLGLTGAAVAVVGVGYGDRPAVTVPAALLVSLFSTAALIRVWAALADVHGQWRAVAMTEGEVAVSFGGIVAPLLVGALAATVLSWRFALVVGAALVLLTVLGSAAAGIPRSMSPPTVRSAARSAARYAPSPLSAGPTLVIVLAIVALEFALSFWLASYLNDSVRLGRELAVTMVSGLYAANLVGRLLASRLARRHRAEGVLLGFLGVSLVGLPVLLSATGAPVAGIGIALTGIGVGATFPLTTALHVAASPRNADSAVGQILGVGGLGQVLGPLLVAVVARSAGLRVGLLLLPAFALLAMAGLLRYRANVRRGRVGSRRPPGIVPN